MSKPGLPADHDQRQAALNIRESILVEAPAGSGKTALLIQRYLKLLGDESVQQPEQVLAITFTRKATEEMKARVLAALQSARTSDAPQEGHELQQYQLALSALRRSEELGWNLPEQPNRMNIRTIDSVCTELARALPVLAGAGALQSPVDDASLLYREAASRVLRHLGGEDAVLNADIRTILLHRDGSLSDCEALIAEMLGLREQWGSIVPLTSDLTDARLEDEVRPRLEAALDHLICTTVSDLLDEMGTDLASKVARLAASFGDEPAYKEIENPYQICKGLTAHPEAAAHALEQWKLFAFMLTTADGKAWRSTSFNRRNLKVDAAKPLQLQHQYVLADVSRNDRLLPMLRAVLSLPMPGYPDDQWKIAKALFRLLRAAMVELQLLFAEREQCDFSELALAARAALRYDFDTSALAAGLGMRLQHLLVDEMQDTSSAQYELLELLTQGWDGRSQTLFLVGDPKQSIYLFRQARVERFLQTMHQQQLGEIPLSIVRLTTNFRSQRHLVTAFNETFTSLFAEEEIRYTEATPQLEAGDKNPFHWHTYQSTQSLRSVEGKEDAVEQARVFAEEIASMAQHNPTWTKAVLVRDRKHLLEIMHAFRASNVPYRAVEIDSLTERIEVLDLLALTRALLHTADRPAWFAVLRAPWCGLSLVDLHLLAGADDSNLSKIPVPRLIETRANLLRPSERTRVERVWDVLHTSMSQRFTQPMAQWIERTWRSLGGDVGLSEEALANAAAFFQLVDSMEQASSPITTLQVRLQKLFATPVHLPGAVDLLTIHKAKGLEWDVVFVPALERKPRGNSARALNWLELATDDSLVLLAPITSREDETASLSKWITSVQNRREQAEKKRLFYVAATRARQELHLYATAHSKTDGSIDAHHDSLLKAVWPAAEPQFAAVLAPVLPFPSLASTQVLFSLAANANEGLQRLPADYDPFVGLRSNPAASIDTRTSFRRPEGGAKARAFGNVIHALVDALAQQIALGLQPDLSTWHARAAALLRFEGLAPSEVHSDASRVVRALEKMLMNPEGLWILQPHPAAASESSFEDETGKRIRIDRSFVAGPEPLVEGDSALWIIDFKSSEHPGEDVATFLAKQKELYAQQMRAYASMRRGEVGPEMAIRLVLYFPLLPAMVWWSAD